MHFGKYIAIFGIICSANCASVNDSWVPPTLIPEPPFGIHSTHYMYTNSSYTWNYGAGPEAYRLTSSGMPYVYYVDNSHSGATDTANTYGTPSTPRLTWPWPVAAGAVVLVKGPGHYRFDNDSGVMKMGGTGTESLPIFFYGFGDTTNIADRPKIDNDYDLYDVVHLHAQWTQIEGFVFTNDTILSTRASTWGQPIRNVCVRSNIWWGQGDPEDNAVCVNVTGGTASAYIENLVVFTNFMTRHGQYNAAAQNDSCGSIFRDFSTNCWFINNYVTYMGGDAIRVGKNVSDTNVAPDVLNHYVGGNYMAHNGENGCDVKKANGVVFSDNIVEDTGYISSGGNQITSTHYAGYDYYYVNNIIKSPRNAGTGFYYSGQQGYIYIIGNLIISPGTRGMYPDRVFGNFNVHNNTLINCPAGIEQTSSINTYTASGNIIYNSTGNELIFQNSTVRSSANIINELYYRTSGSLAISWGSTYTSVAAWIAGTPVGDGSIQADPLFVNPGAEDYRLQATSPAITSNTAWLSDFNARYTAKFGRSPGTLKDIAGTTRVNWNLGAFEYDSGVTPKNVRHGGKGTITGAGRF